MRKRKKKGEESVRVELICLTLLLKKKKKKSIVVQYSADL